MSVELPPVDAQGRFQQELRAPSVFARLFAKLVDSFVAGLTALGFSALLPLPVAALIALTWFWYADWAGSPGKWLFSLKVVSLAGAPCTLVQSLKRNVIPVLPSVGRALIASGWFEVGAPLGPTGMSWDRALLSCVGLLLAASEVFAMVMQPQGRRWGDRFAGTRVVKK